MRAQYASGLLACVAAMAPAIASAQDQRTLQIDEAQTLRFTRSIARIEVNRDNVIAVSAPTSQSLRVSGQGAGDAALSVYAADGSMIGETQFHVDPPPRMRAPTDRCVQARRWSPSTSSSRRYPPRRSRRLASASPSSRATFRAR
ncbi:pilus assembly protein N-terminal domain-containing protein [Novosphingobium resinovorum]